MDDRGHIVIIGTTAIIKIKQKLYKSIQEEIRSKIREAKIKDRFNMHKKVTEAVGVLGREKIHYYMINTW